MRNFESYLIRKGLRTSTVALRVQCLGILLKISPKLNPQEIDTYLTEKYKNNASPGYLNSLIVALHAFGEYSNNKELMDIKQFPVKETYKGVLSDQEIKAFLTLPRPEKSRGNAFEKMTMFFTIMAYTGMRSSEVHGLTVDQVNFGRGVFELPITKGSPRIVPINTAIYAAIETYIKALEGDLLFPNVSRDTRRLHFKDRLRRLGIKRPKITPHSLRYSYIGRMLGEDVNLMKVQRIVGHKQVATTARYYKYVSKDLIEASRKDPLSRTSLSFDERFREARNLLRKVLADFTFNPSEERKMRHMLLDSL